MARKKKEESAPGAPLWLVTYGDMVTLVLTFFVLLFSFSSIDVQKFEMMIMSFQGALGFMPGGKSVQQDPAVFGGQPATQAGESRRVTPDIQQVAQNLRNYLRSEGLDKEVVVRIDQRGLPSPFGPVPFRFRKSGAEAGGYEGSLQDCRVHKGFRPGGGRGGTYRFRSPQRGNIQGQLGAVIGPGGCGGFIPPVQGEFRPAEAAGRRIRPQPAPRTERHA